MSRHVAETDLALFISGDISMWKYVLVTVHTAGCEACRARMESYRANRKRLKQAAAELPIGQDWERLAAEMTANIRVGLAAGECVAPRRRRTGSFAHRPAAMWAGAAAGVVVLLGAAFWLNLPASDADSLGRFARTLVHGAAQSGNRGASSAEDRGPVVEASADGVELRENGVAVSIPQGPFASPPFGVAVAPSRPVAVTVSAPGSASARYVDADTGQMTITSVYVQ